MSSTLVAPDHPLLAENLRTHGFCDVKIVCKDSQILWAHKLILGSVSPLLKSILSSIDEDGLTTLLLPEFDILIMKIVLDYIYGQKAHFKTKDLNRIGSVIGILHLQIHSISIVEKSKDSQIWTPINKTEHSTFFSILSRTSLCGSHNDRTLNSSFKKSSSNRVSTNKNSYECVMCSKSFNHPQNLKIHLQTHLGLNIQLKSCSTCKRVFRSNIEENLHRNSHNYSVILKRLRKNRKPSFSFLIAQRIIRKYLFLRKRLRKVETPKEIIVPSPVKEVKSSNKLKLKIRLSIPESSSKPELPKNLSTRSKKVKILSPRKRVSSSEESLTCPTCDKLFLANSILARHLKTSALCSVKTPPVTEIYPKPVQPTVVVGGKELPKYECHLCSQVFLRVKDLAKHRAKVCSAYHI